MHQLAMDYPSHRSGLANPRTDNRKPRPRHPRPNRWGPPAPHSRPTSRKDHCEPNAAKPVRRSIDARSSVLDASHRPNHWALATSPDPATRPGLLSWELERALPPIPTRESAFRSPTGLS